MKMRAKIFILLLACSIIPSLVVVWLGDRIGRHVLREQVGESSLEFARLGLRKIEEFVYLKYESAHTWARVVEHWDSMHNDRRSGFSDYLALMVEKSEDFFYVAVLNEKGNIIASSDSTLLGRKFPDSQDLGQLDHGQASIHGPMLDPLVNKQAVIFSIPVSDHEGSEMGTLLRASLKWTRVTEMINMLQIGGAEQSKADHFMLFDREGLTISCFVLEEMFKENLIEHGMDSAKYAMQKKEGFLTEMSEHGLLTFATYTYSKRYRNLPALDWHLVLEQDPSRVFAASRSLRWAAMYTLFAVIGVLVVVSIIFAHKITRPLRAVTQAAQLMAQRDLGTGAVVESKDEIGVVAVGFNNMVDSLLESENRYKALFESCPDGILVAEPNTRKFLYANPTICKMLGYSKTELEGMAVDDIIPKNELPRVIGVFEAQARGEIDLATDIPILRKDGTIFYADVNSAPIVVGREMQLLGFFRDVTGRKEAEQTLRASEEKYRTLCQDVPGMVYRGLPDWSAEAVANSEMICGYSIDEFNSGKVNWLEIIHPDDRQAVMSEANAMSKTPGDIIQQYRIIAKDGSIHWVEDHKTPLFEDGTYRGG